MKDNSEFNDLVVSYLLNELNEEDKTRLTSLLESDERLRKDFEQLVETDRVLRIKGDIDDIDLQQEWKLLQEKWVTGQGGLQAVHINDEAPELQEPDAGKNAYRLLKRFAVAASLIFLVGIAWLLIRFTGPSKTDGRHVTETVKEEEQVFLHKEQNISGKTKALLLEDGSEVLLWDRSTINYAKPFGQGKRDIFLEGKGFFKVANDPAKPFTVYSAGISTRAIGTRFFVTNYESEEIIRVQLVEGKVVIESVDSARVKLKQPVFLLPGQEIVYNKVTGEVKTLRVRRQNVRVVAGDSMLHDNPSIPVSSDGSWYMFNNQSLSDIFEQLENMFGVQIEYRPADVQKLYFIGKFDKKDSLEYILKYITSINNLKFQKENKKYIITK